MALGAPRGCQAAVRELGGCQGVLGCQGCIGELAGSVGTQASRGIGA